MTSLGPRRAPTNRTRPLVGGDDDLLVLQQRVGASEDLGVTSSLLVPLHVHEDVRVAVVVEVLQAAAVDRGDLDLGAGVERLVDGLVRLDVLELGAHGRGALARLDVLELHDGPHCPSMLSTMPFFRSFVDAMRASAPSRQIGDVTRTERTGRRQQPPSLSPPSGKLPDRQPARVQPRSGEGGDPLQRHPVAVDAVPGDDRGGVRRDHRRAGTPRAAGSGRRCAPRSAARAWAQASNNA